MGEWVILGGLVVLLAMAGALVFAFAGCSTFVESPTIAAGAMGPTTVRLTWSFTEEEADGFKIERTKAGASKPAAVPAGSSPFDDTGLEASTTYTYVLEVNYRIAPSRSSTDVTTYPAPGPPPPPAKPIVKLGAVTATSVSAISISFTLENRPLADVLEFKIERTKVAAGGKVEFSAPGSPFTDKGLDADTEYSYTVQALFKDGSKTDPSAQSPPVRTRAYRTTYERKLPNASTNWGGYSMAVRIDPAGLAVSGRPVRLTLRAARDSEAHIDKVYISQAGPGPGRPEPYDSVDPLMPVTTTKVVVPKSPLGGVYVLPAVDFFLDESRPLLVAVDFSPAPAPTSAIGSEASSPDNVALGYYKGAAQEAAKGDRTGLVPANPPAVYLIEKIEVGG